MVDFKEIIYGSYVSTHNSHMYGSTTLETIKSKFPVWNYYYAHQLPKSKDAHILDIGCGDGGFIYWLQQLGYHNSAGIDISGEQIELGKSLGIQNLHHADLLPYLRNNDKGFDMVIARDVIEHFTRNEVFEILISISESLKTGGSFMMQVPNGQGMNYTSIFYGDYTHEMAYTHTSVNQIALNTGYVSSTCYPMGPPPVGIFSVIRYILWRYKAAKLRFWKMVETGNSNGIFTQNLIAILKK